MMQIQGIELLILPFFDGLVSGDAYYLWWVHLDVHILL